MAINPLNETHRQRLTRSVEHSYQELKRFNNARRNTVNAYLGVNPYSPEWDWGANNSYRKALPKGNLLQQAGLSMQIALAYGEPEFLCTPRVPEQTGLAEKLQVALNRMAKLLNLGEVARSVAADSFFGYGIFKCGVGRLPLSARVALGLEYGPCVWRVSQDDFIYDTQAADFDNCPYVGDIYSMPLDEAQRDYPEHADRLQTMVDSDRLDAPRVMARASRMFSAQQDVWMVDLYFPGAGGKGTGLIGTWPIRNDQFGELANEPIAVNEHTGHWSGIYQVLNHLYSPDELIPIAQAESVKSIHFMFQDLLHLTSEQAVHAKVNPLYLQGNDRDMQKLWNAKDRHPVPVSQMGLQQAQARFEIPGPTQSQTAYMSVLLNLFKEMSPTLDEPQRAPTATQGTLERETTNAIVAEARRKFNRALQLVGYKLGHLLMNDENVVLPASTQLRPGSRMSVDMTWRKPVTNERIDDFEIGIEPHSTQLRTPDSRLQMMLGLNQQIAMLMQLQAQGAPINVEQAINDIAELAGEPRIKNWYEAVDPLHQAQRQQSRASVQRVGVGQYTRHNTSERSNQGAMMQALTQMGANASPEENAAA